MPHTDLSDTCGVSAKSAGLEKAKKEEENKFYYLASGGLDNAIKNVTWIYKKRRRRRREKERKYWEKNNRHIDVQTGNVETERLQRKIGEKKGERKAM